MSLNRAQKVQAFLFAVAIHVLAAFAFLFSITFDKPAVVAPPSNAPIMEAVAIDQSQIEAEVKKLKDSERKKREAEEKRQKELESRAEEMRKQREAEEERLKQVQEEKQKVEEEKKRTEELRERAELEKQAQEDEREKIEEQKRLALEEKQKAEQERKEVEEQKQKALEEKKQAEEEKKQREEEMKKAEEEKQKAIEEKKRAEEEKQKAEEEKKQREEEARKAREEAEAAQREKELQEQMQAEEEAARLNQLIRDALSEYTAIWQSRITSNFNDPRPGSDLRCTLKVKLTDTGEVVSVRVDPSSGDPAFDRQAELAVLKSSPLPVPTDPKVQKGLAGKTLSITFDPEG